MSSQPSVESENWADLKRTNSLQSKKMRRLGVITPEERDSKIEEFKRFMSEKIEKESQEINENEESDQAFVSDPSTAFFYYFMGRGNPLHEGHVHALKQLIETADKNNAVPLILLGNGPKPKKASDKLNDPISFDLKQRFLKYKLDELFRAEGLKTPRYIIKEKSSAPAQDVSRYIQDALENYGPDVQDIIIAQFAGDKGEDAKKLDFIKPIVVAKATELRPSSVVTTITEPINPIKNDGEEMSATRVRKYAYNCYLNEQDQDINGEDCFKQKYGWFYKDFTSEIYNGILSPLFNPPSGMSAITQTEIQNYIDGIVESKKSKGKAKGGFKNKTKRKRKNKTNKRKKYKKRIIKTRRN